MEQIVEAGIDIADAEGLEALSMRKVAEALGVATMSLYSHVPSKAELIDLMVDRASAKHLNLGTVLHEGPTAPSTQTWRSGLEAIARGDWGLYRRHPWLLQVSTSRPNLGPATMDKYERDLRVIEGLGLSDVEMDATVSMINGFVRGVAAMAAEAQASEGKTGVSDQEWWESFAPLLAEVMDESAYPTASRVGATVGEEFQSPNQPDFVFEFGLQRLLDGVARLIEQRQPGQPGEG
ncbi:TetR/AcrR family transcriptional regulator [Natronoglycomyces albus]|uniref:TetR/AcrR family transcriptional regulator n=1 Tax=Natronoglycomyces albus TaxID=2811108 RepID=A0A895XJ03_9ACTN|nr:TetR/AcrR family transcriptional regulator [Natronoglycomyces albus]